MKSRDTRASKADATAYSTTTAAIGSVIAGPNVAVLHAAPLDKHPSMPILRIDEANRCSAHPPGCQVLITFHSKSLREPAAKVETSAFGAGHRTPNEVLFIPASQAFLLSA